MGSLWACLGWAGCSRSSSWSLSPPGRAGSRATSTRAPESHACLPGCRPLGRTPEVGRAPGPGHLTFHKLPRHLCCCLAQCMSPSLSPLIRKTRLEPITAPSRREAPGAQGWAGARESPICYGPAHRRQGNRALGTDGSDPRPCEQGRCCCLLGMRISEAFLRLCSARGQATHHVPRCPGQCPRAPTFGLHFRPWA